MYEARLSRLFALFGVGLAVLAGRAFQLQVVEAEERLAAHEEKLRRSYTILPRRGEILYADGTPMASNEPGFSVHVDPVALLGARWRCHACTTVVQRKAAPSRCKECGSRDAWDETAPPDQAALARVLGCTPAVLQGALDAAEAHKTRFSEHRLHTLFQSVSRDVALALAQRAAEFPGIEVRAAAGRLVDPTARSVVGITAPADEEDVQRLVDPARAERGEFVYRRTDVYRMRFGRSGLERAFDDALRGQPAHAVRRLRADRTLEPEAELDRPVVDGAPLRTSLRSSVQAAAAEIVAQAPGAAAAVVLDVRDGGVVAIASKSEDGMHHAVSRVAPGSVFKLVTALAFLEGGGDPAWTVHCERQGTLPSGRRYRCEGSHGDLALEAAFAHSCNAYFMACAEKAGLDAIVDACCRLGLETNPRLHLTGTTAGLEYSPYRVSPWYRDDLGYIGIGQGKSTASPLQVAVAYARLAAGGRRVTAALGASERPGAEAAQIDSPLSRHAPLLQRAARLVVTEGTGRRAPTLAAVAASGKSGTAEVPRREGEPGAGNFVNNAWFVAYAPHDAPRFVSVVVFERVPDHGAARAAEPAAKLLEEALRER